MATKTIGAGQDYETIAEWSDSIKLLGALTENEVGQLTDDAVYSRVAEDDLDFTLVTRGAFTITLQATSNRHNGDFGTGSRIEHSTASNSESIYEAYWINLEDLSFSQTNATGSGKDCLKIKGGTLKRVIAKTIAATSGDAFDVQNAGTLAFEACRGEATAGSAFRVARAGTVLNACTALNSVTGFEFSNTHTGTARNNVAYNCTTDFSGTMSGTYNNNASEDATHPGTGVTIVGDPFSDGYTPTAAGQLDAAGADLSIVLDAANLAYDPTPSIGAYEVTSADTTAPVLTNATGASTGATLGTGTVDTTDGSGTVFYYPSVNATELEATVETSGYTDPVSSSGTLTVNFSGLTAETLYFVHYFHDDASANRSNLVSSAGFRTPASSAVYDGEVIFPDSILFHANGEHDGLDNASVLSDSTANWTPGEWDGLLLRNVSDTSEGVISGNTQTTITATLAGGDNDWDINDRYEIVINLDAGDVINYPASVRVENNQYTFNYSITDTSTAVTSAEVPATVTATGADDGWGILEISPKGVPTLEIGGAVFASDIRMTLVGGTLTHPDSAPDSFQSLITDQTDVPLSDPVTSNSFTPVGVDSFAQSVISVDVGTYSLNGNAFTAADGVWTPVDSIRLQHDASGTNSDDVVQTVTIGGVPGTFTSTTIGSSSVVIAFSDLISAPREGWSVAESSKGAAVTIWGRGFGTPGVRGSNYVTVGGVNLTADTDYPDTWCLRSNPIPWLDSICFHLNDSIPTGNTTISVTVGGVESNTVPFAVNASGDIHFVDINGSGADVGTFEDPWLIPGTDFVNGTSGGDVTYFRGGTYDQAYNGGGSRAVIRNNFNNTGTAAAPIAYVGYPGEVAFIDSDTNGGSGSLHTCIDMEADYITCAKFKTKAYAVSMGVDRVGGRAVGNDCQGPLQGLSGVGNINIIQSGAVVLGNTVWGCRTQDKLDHAIYASGCQPLAPAEIAYNYAYDNQFDRGPIFSENHQDDRCRAGEYMQPNRWHSNVAEGGTGLFASRGFYQETLSYEVGDPGGVPTTYFYNNILYRCGQADFASIGVNRSDCGVFNNTCIDENSVSIVLTINMATLGDNVNAKNNIFIQAAGNSYDMVQIDGGTIDLDTNCYWNGTAAPEDVNPFITDPDVIYAPQSYTPVTMGAASSAKNNGTTDVDITTLVTKDFYLQTRTGTMDIGAVNIED